MNDTKRFDLVALDARTTADDVDRAVDRAARERYAAVVAPPAFARRAVDRARGTGVEVWSVVSHPLGLDKPTVKSIAATSLAKDQVTGLEVAPLLANAADPVAFRNELLEIARGARAANPAIVLSVRLDVDRVDAVLLATAVLQGAFDGVVLDGADVEAILAAAPAFRNVSLRVKAIARDPAEAARLLAAGLDRVGIAALP